MKSLVTGATGLLGANLVRKLVAQGKKVRVLIRKTSNTLGIDGIDVEKFYGDIRDYKSVLRAVDGCEYIYHVASYTDLVGDRKTCFEVNLDGTLNVAKAVMEAGSVKMVYASSASALGWGTMENPATEETAFNLDFMIGNLYTDSKREATRRIMDLQKKGLPVVITYPTLMIGPWDTRPSSGQLIIRIATMPSLFYPVGGGNIIDVEDAAIGHIQAMEKGRIGERYIIGNENLYHKDSQAIVLKCVGKKTPRFQVLPSLMVFSGYINDFFSKITARKPVITPYTARYANITHFLSAEKAQRELGLPQSPVEYAIEKEIKWLKDYKYF